MTLAKVYGDNMSFYNQVDPKFATYYKEDSEEALMVMARLFSVAKQNNQPQLIKELEGQYMIPDELKQMFE